MRGAIFYIERSNTKSYTSGVYRIENVQPDVFAQKVLWFKAKNPRRLLVLGTSHFRYTGKTMPVEE